MTRLFKGTAYLSSSLVAHCRSETLFLSLKKKKKKKHPMAAVESRRTYCGSCDVDGLYSLFEMIAFCFGQQRRSGHNVKRNRGTRRHQAFMYSNVFIFFPFSQLSRPLSCRCRSGIPPDSKRNTPLLFCCSARQCPAASGGVGGPVSFGCAPRRRRARKFPRPSLSSAARQETDRLSFSIKRLF